MHATVTEWGPPAQAASGVCLAGDLGLASQGGRIGAFGLLVGPQGPGRQGGALGGLSLSTHNLKMPRPGHHRDSELDSTCEIISVKT